MSRMFRGIGLAQLGERLVRGEHVVSLSIELIAHCRDHSGDQIEGVNIGEGLAMVLLSWKHSGRGLRAMSRANIRWVCFGERNMTDAHDVLKHDGILRVEMRRVLDAVKTVVGREVWRSMRRGHLGMGVGVGSPMSLEGTSCSPISTLHLRESSARWIKGAVPRMPLGRRLERPLTRSRRCMGTGARLAVHTGREMMGWSGR
jgi:hypothetical protein